MHDLLVNTLGPSLSLDLELDEGQVPIMADAHQLELAILNLSINARDAMPSGGKLSISARPRFVAGEPDLRSGEYLELRVSDTGKGMTPEIASRAFEPFFTTKPVGSGTGLGLSMVYGVTKQSGGTVRIESIVGEGTTVSLLLPRTSESISENAGAIQASATSTTSARILVVDDDHGVRQVLVDTLNELGHSVRSASEGTEGIAIAQRETFDLIILDYAMPGLSGAEVAQALRKAGSKQRILFVTGYSDTAAIEAAAGDAPVLRKPFLPGELATVINRALTSGR